MKKTFSVNIAGVLFNIDEDAFETLNRYFAELKRHFSGNESKDEIIADIESRVAEMFQLKQGSIIGLNDVEEAIKVLGRPSEISDDEPIEEQESAQPVPRRLYRDGDKRVLGGIASGMGAYFNTDPVWFRLGFVASFFAVGPLLYLIFWIAVPKARTTAEKLEMKGGNVSIRNIENRVGSNAGRGQNSNTGERVSHLGGIFLKIILIGAGAMFLLMGFGMVMSALAIFLIPMPGIALTDGSSSTTLYALLPFVTAQDSGFGILGLGIILSTVIPVLWLVYVGLRLVFNISFGNRKLFIISLAIWIMGAILCTIGGIRVAGGFTSTGDTFEKQAYSIQAAQLQIRLNEDQNFYFDNFMEEWRHTPGSKEGKAMLSLPVDLKIEKYSGDSLEVILRKTAHGAHPAAARKRAKNIEYSYALTDSTLVLAPDFLISQEDGWRAQELQIIIKVPSAMDLQLDDNVKLLMERRTGCGRNEFHFQGNINAKGGKRGWHAWEVTD